MTGLQRSEARVGAQDARRARLWLARGPRIAEWLLMALIAFLLARTLIAFFAPLPLPKGDRLAAAGAGVSEETQIIGKNPFPASETAPAPVETENLAETALDLGLNGVWPAEQTPSAIIRRPDGKQRRYAVGEEVVSGVRLVSVFSDHVAIEQNGVRETLRFENKAPVERPEASQSAPSPAPASSPVNGPADPPEKISNASDMRALSNYVRFGLGVDPNEGGAAVMIYAGRNRDAFEEAGFRDGDIVRSINGAPVSANPAEMSKLINQIIENGAATVGVERDGRTQTLRLSLSELGNE